MEEIKIQKLDGDNYNAWKIRARAVLVQKNCWEAIDPGYAAELKPDEKKNNEKALTFLFLVVEDQFLDDIAECERAKEAWDILKNIHTKFGLLHSLQLLKEFFNVTLKPEESISSYLSRLMDLHRKVSSCGHGLADREVALVMLMGLPKEYEGLILNLEREEDTLSTQIVKSRLIVEEKKLLRYTEAKSEATTKEFMGEKALKTRDKYRTKPMQPLQKQHNNPDRRTRCFSCGIWGHIARFCPTAKKPQAKMASDEVYQALFADSCGEKPASDWYLDSGATEHMCSQEQRFMNLTSIKSQVEIANSEKIEVSGTGDILLNPVSDCGEITIHLANVLYVPKLEGNLLSVGRIEEMGMTVCFEKAKAIIRDPGQQNKVILTAHRRGRLYKIEEKQAHKVYFSKHEETMHRRLGHFHTNAVKKLIKGNDSNVTYEEIPQKESVCSTCVLGKMKKTPFPKEEAERSTRLLQLIHSDVVGPITPTSKGGSKYLVTFVDDYSRYAVVKPMKSKDQVLKEFIEYKIKVENLHGLKITTLRSDNGGEYINNEFDDFLTRNGIRRQLTVPRVPQQNGVAEKMNHTLFDMTRCLLLDSNIPHELWADAVTTACYLRNKCPSKAVGGNIPEELWFKKPVRISHLRIFGCRVFAQIDKTQRKGKLGKRAQECVFIGYPEGVKGYKLWNTQEDKFLVSRDVKFDETVFPLRRSQTTTQAKKKNELFFNLNHECNSDSEANAISLEVPTSSTTAEVEDVEVPLNDKVGETEDSEPAILEDTNISNEGTIEVRKSTREKRPKTYYGDPVLYKAVCEEQPANKPCMNPTSVEEAMSSPNAEMWREAMKEELSNLHENQTWELVPKPAGIKPIGCKWVFKVKQNAEGEIMKYKARLVAKGYSQVPGRDFTETFSPVVKIKSLRILLALAVELQMDIHQMDITSAYLNGLLKEDIYMVQPEGSQEQGKEHLVCHLKRSLYGLKQSGREWNECFNSFLKNCGLARSKCDPCIYYHPNKALYIGIYVDDMLIVGTLKEINAFKQMVMQRFKARDLGEASEILSMRIQKHADGTLTLDQTAYIEEILEEFKLESIKGASTPMDPTVKHQKVDDEEWNNIKAESERIPYRQAIGSLLYLACGTRPDIAFSATYMSQFNERPSEFHWRSVKHLFRYLKETKHLSLAFRKTGRPLEIFSDADWGADKVDRKSFSGYVLILGGAAISWCSKKQSTVALSSAEAEYVAAGLATKEVLWIRGLLKELGMLNFMPSPSTIKVDNQAAMFIAQNQTTSERSKHMDIKHHFIRDYVQQSVIQLKYVNSKDNIADLLTKNISKTVLTNLRKYLGFCK